MKNLMIAMTTASTLAISSAAFAATDVSQSVMEQVDTALDSFGFTEVDPAGLSDNQMIGIYVAATSSDDAEDARTTIEGILTDAEIDYLTPQFADTVRSFLNEADRTDVRLADLTERQIVEFYVAATSTDSTDEQEGKIDAILAMEGEDDASQLRRQVETALDTLGYENVEVGELTDTQVVQIFTAYNSSDDQAVAREKVDAALQ